ncbi:MAG: sigma-70 family RNA polymerase sigma factor [Gammaproteobacteria bacterium]
MSANELSTTELLDVLYREHHAWLMGWLWTRVGCRYLAEDHAHDAFVRFIAVPDVRAVREPRAYLATIAHGLLVNHRRRRAIERAYWEAMAAEPAGLAPSPEEHALILETLLEIDAALDKLPNRVRSAFLMAQIEGLSYAEIGSRLGVSERMVKKYMARAMLHCLTVRV